MATRRKATAKTATKKAAPKTVDEAVKEITKETAGKTEEFAKELDKAAAKTVANEVVTVCLNFPFDLKYKVDVNGKEEVVVFKGNATSLKGKSKGILPIGAFGITPNVPKAVWDYIVKTRPDDEKIKKGLLFATTAAKADGAVAERAKTRHGFEPVKVK